MSVSLRVNNLTKYFGQAAVVNGLTFEVPAGSVFALIGPNGAGKTTTIKILMNIVKPASGRAEVLGVDSRRLGPEILTRIGYVSENQEMPGWMTVRFMMSYLKPFYPTWDDTRAAELMREFDLPPDRQLRHLSRGMWMKAAMTASLAYRPALLILDEPFSGLDPLVREDLIGGLIESAAETTILLSSHDLADIESFASHIGYLEAGRLKFSEEMNSLAARFREIEVARDSAGSPEEKQELRFLKGWFRDTLPTAPIDEIAVLRLDGDMYESTYVALSSLYPKISVGGFLIIDDYGALPNCRSAVEDYRTQYGIAEEIHQVDWTGVYWRKHDRSSGQNV